MTSTTPLVISSGKVFKYVFISEQKHLMFLLLCLTTVRNNMCKVDKHSSDDPHILQLKDKAGSRGILNIFDSP